MVAVERDDCAGLPGAEAQLWAAVLYQVLVDLVSHDAGFRDEAEAWVGGRPRPAFVTLCGLAGIEDVSAAHGLFLRVARAPLGLRRGLITGLEGYGRGAAKRWSRLQDESGLPARRTRLQRARDAAGEAQRHVG